MWTFYIVRMTSLTHLGVCLVVMVTTSLVKGDTCTLGNPLNAYHNPSLANWMNIFTDLKFSCKGVLTSWSYFAQNPGTFYPSVWRPDTRENTLTLVGWNLVTTDQAGPGKATIRAGEQIMVQQGDVIGIFYDKDFASGVVSMLNYVNDSSLCCNLTYYDLSNTLNIFLFKDQVRLGQTLQWSNQALRMPALQAEVNTGQAEEQGQVQMIGVEGGSVACPCHPGTKVVWSKDGNTLVTYESGSSPSLQSSDQDLQFDPTTGIMIISDLGVSNQGVYSCKAENQDDDFAVQFPTVECNVEVHVYPEGMTLTGDLGPVPENSTQVYECKVDRVYPSLSEIQWLVGGRLLLKDPSQFLDSSFNLDLTLSQVSQLSLHVKHEYNNSQLTCLVQLDSRVYLKSILLRVGDDIKAVQVREGQNVTLSCNEGSSGLDSVAWHKSVSQHEVQTVVSYKKGSPDLDPPVYYGSNPKDSIFLNISSGDLTLTKVKVTHEAAYMCLPGRGHKAERLLQVTVLPSGVIISVKNQTSTGVLTLLCNITNVRPEITHVEWTQDGHLIKSEPGSDLPSSQNKDGTLNQWSHLVVHLENIEDLKKISCRVVMGDAVVIQPYTPSQVRVPSGDSNHGAVIALAIFLTLALSALFVIAILLFLRWRRKKQEPKRMSALQTSRDQSLSQLDPEGRPESMNRYTADPTGHAAAMPKDSSAELDIFRHDSNSNKLRPLPTLPDQEPMYLELQTSLDENVSPGPDPLAGIHAMSTLDEYQDMSPDTGNNRPDYLNYDATDSSSPQVQVQRAPQNSVINRPDYLNMDAANRDSLPLYDQDTPSNSVSHRPDYHKYSSSPTYSSTEKSRRPQSELDVEVKAKHNSFKVRPYSVDTAYLPMTGTLERERGLDVEVKPKGTPLKSPLGDDYLNVSNFESENVADDKKGAPQYLDMTGLDSSPNKNISSTPQYLNMASMDTAPEQQGILPENHPEKQTRTLPPSVNSLEAAEDSQNFSLPGLSADMTVHMPPLDSSTHDSNQSLDLSLPSELIPGSNNSLSSSAGKGGKGSRIKRQQRLTAEDPDDLDPSFSTQVSPDTAGDQLDADIPLLTPRPCSPGTHFHEIPDSEDNFTNNTEGYSDLSLTLPRIKQEDSTISIKSIGSSPELKHKFPHGGSTGSSPQLQHKPALGSTTKVNLINKSDTSLYNGSASPTDPDLNTSIPHPSELSEYQNQENQESDQSTSIWSAGDHSSKFESHA